MGLRGGAEVGRAVHALLRAGVVRLAADERPEDFAGFPALGVFP